MTFLLQDFLEVFFRSYPLIFLNIEFADHLLFKLKLCFTFRGQLDLTTKLICDKIVGAAYCNQYQCFLIETSEQITINKLIFNTENMTKMIPISATCIFTVPAA